MIEPKTYTIVDKDLPVTAFLWDQNFDKTLLFVGGDGDGKSKFVRIVERLLSKGLESNILTISFGGVEESKNQPLIKQAEELKLVFDWMQKDFNQNVDLFCTSAGAYSVVHLITDPEYNKSIENVIFADPADYNPEDTKTACPDTWNGYENYTPGEDTIVNLLKSGVGNAKVHVVNFLLRNFGKDGYINPENRHIDNTDMFARVNNDMVKRFYDNTPEGNRGFYVENEILPHAFMRDGNVEENVEILAGLIVYLLRSNG